MADYAARIAILESTYDSIAAQPASEWGEGGHNAKMMDLRKIREEIEAWEIREANSSGSGRVFKPLVDSDYG